VYTSSVLRGAPYAFFIKFHLLIKKKKKTFLDNTSTKIKKKNLSKLSRRNPRSLIC